MLPKENLPRKYRKYRKGSVTSQRANEAKIVRNSWFFFEDEPKKSLFWVFLNIF